MEDKTLSDKIQALESEANALARTVIVGTMPSLHLSKASVYLESARNLVNKAEIGIEIQKKAEAERPQDPPNIMPPTSMALTEEDV